MAEIIKLNVETQDFFEGLLDGSADIARKYVAMARKGDLAKTDKGGRSDGNPVTLADTEIQQYIYDRLYGNEAKGINPSRFKDAGFLGEEENEILRPKNPSGNYPQLRFVVDPLDGTKPFTIGHNHWTVCNFALQQSDAEGKEWKTVISGAYSPEKDIAVLADNERVIVRSYGWFGDHRYHPLTELRPTPVHSAESGPDGQPPQLKGKHLDLRLVSHDKAQAELWQDLQQKGFTVRNAGPIAATFLEFLAGKPGEFSIIAGKPGGEWDWRAAEHFLTQAGFKAELVTYKGMDAKGKDYPAFIAAGDPQVFEYLKRRLGQTLERQKGQSAGAGSAVRVA